MGNKYILTITDAFTKYSGIMAIPNKEAETVADAVVTKWICRYGVHLLYTWMVVNN
jgi:hypothetical protein